jgi:hypothetical protein
MIIESPFTGSRACSGRENPASSRAGLIACLDTLEDEARGLGEHLAALLISSASLALADTEMSPASCATPMVRPAPNGEALSAA